MLPEEHYNIV